MPKERKGKVLQCSECGKEVYVHPSQLERWRHCSMECMWKASERRTHKVCPRCGKEFNQSPSVGKYCSWECYQAARQKRETCAVCGKALTKAQAIYCSHACRDDGRRTLEERPCEVCGTPMKVQPHRFGKQRVCSWECNHELKRLTGPGARVKRSDGYIAIYYPKHPDAAKDGRVLEHRLVMEKKIGRRITPDEQVHHINHIRDDNRPENLEVMNAGDHARETIAVAKAQRLTQKQRLAEYERRFGPLPD